MVEERIKSKYEKAKGLLKTVFGVARYGVSKAEFSNYEDEKASLSRYVKTFSPSFFLPCGCLGFVPYTRSRVGQIHVRVGMRDLVARYVNLLCLST
jgi:hypothetical protein